jgi:hypothetical protein
MMNFKTAVMPLVVGLGVGVVAYYGSETTRPWAAPIGLLGLIFAGIMLPEQESVEPTELATTNPDEPAGPELIVRTGLALASVVGLALASVVGAPVAMAVSYKRNKSVIWAFLSGFVWTPYLIYVLVIDPKET